MSEEKPKRNYRRRRPTNRDSRQGTPDSGIDSRTSSISRTSTNSLASTTSNPGNRNKRRGGQRDNQKERSTPKHSDNRPRVKQETRDDEINLLNHTLVAVPNVKLINSSNKAKIYSASFDNNELYKLTIPIIKSLPIQLQSFPEKPFNPNVIKNFNNKVKHNDRSLAFYTNLLVNDFDHLSARAEDYKLYNITKTQTIEEQQPAASSQVDSETTIIAH